MRRLPILFLLLALSWLALAAHARTTKALNIYVIDVEGGEATLFVSPTGESMLVDTGWADFDGRDAGRIVAAAKDAGVKQIDHLVITHFHGDHMGGVKQLSDRMTIRQFIDHGTTVQGGQELTDFQAYAAIRDKSAHMIAKPGDKIPIAGFDARIIAAGGETLSTPLPGAGKPNPWCADFKFQGGRTLEQEKTTRGEDPMSVSTFITFGKFRTQIMGDLTWNMEYSLMCPNNRIGTVGLYLVSHHGTDTSGSPALVYALHPRAAVMNNSPVKGGSLQTLQILRKSPDFEDLWQNHFSIAGGEEYNSSEQFIANLDQGSIVTQDGHPSAAPVHMGPANWNKISAQSDGTFTITNSRNNFSRTYRPRP